MPKDRRSRADFRYFRSVPTRWSDNDIYGHVNNAVYYTWFDTSVNAWLIERGVLDIHAGTSVSLVAETGCRYFQSLAYPETVEIGLVVDRLGTSSVTYGVAAFREGTPFAAAQGHFVHVLVDRATQRPTPIPDAMREVLSSLQNQSKTTT